MAWLVAAAAVAWFSCLLGAPMAPPAISAAAYALGSLVCHQMAGRSFHYGLVQLPVCARCIGIYGGAALGAVVFAWRAPQVSSLRLRAVLMLGMAPVAVTVATEWTGLWDPGNAVRAVTGVAAGVAAAFVVIGAAATLHYDECGPRRLIAPNPPRTSI